MLSRFGSLVKKNWLLLCAFVWLIVLTGSVCLIFKYDSVPGLAARPTGDWPSSSSISHSSKTNTLVMLLHPRCPCSRASLRQVATLKTSDRSLRCVFLFYAPTRFEKGWEKTDIWIAAAEIPDAQLVSDVDGAEARKFGGATSGQTYIFDRNGNLRYSGGLTEGRGHEGECLSLDLALRSLKSGSKAAYGEVFGCPILDSGKTRL